MNRLTEEEFRDRVEAVNRARRIFIDLTAGNITNAFILYQEVLAEQDREIILNTIQHGYRARTPLDGFKRPRCPECEAEMMFRVVQPNDEGVVTQLVCSRDSCDVVLDSDHDLAWWAEELRKDMGNG